MKKRLFFFLFITLGVLSAMAQTPTTQGKEFWASFMRNGYNTTTGSYNHFTLIASAKHACTVTVSNPYTGWSDQFSVQNNGVSTYYVNRNQGYNDQMGGKAYKGLFIASTDTISLYIANEAENSYDAANVLPASALGSQYMIQSYKAVGDQSGHPGDSRASFLVLATEDNTVVNITPSCQTYDNHPAGQAYSVTLNRGECYHVLNKNAGTNSNVDGDFSGTRVESVDNKPIAVFNGNSITSVPGGLSTGYDHVFEQAMPTDYWGKQFVVTSTRCPSYMNLQADQIKVTALLDNTTVTRNGAELFTLNAGQSNFFQMNLVSDPCTYLEADNPIAVFLYQHSHGDGTPAYGDPSMVWISPVEQNVYEVTFSTFEVQEVEVHYVNVVCHSENVADMTLDGQDISDSFTQVPGFPELSYTRMSLNHAAHTLRCPGGFTAHVYGIGQAEGYAYSVGSSAKQLTRQLYVDGMPSTDFPDGYATCKDDPVTFRVETNYEIDHVSWDFGDNNSGLGNEVSHAYDTSGDFDVMSVIYREMDNQVQPFDTLSIAVHVNPTKEYDMDPITACGATYTFNDASYPVPGNYNVRLETSMGCDSIVHLHLLQGTTTTYTLPRVWACEQYEWFGEIYTQTNHHLEHLVEDATPEGCDSLYILDLTITSPPENPEVTIASCEPIYHFGYLLTHTVDTTKTYNIAGCEFDSILHFILLPNEELFDTINTCDSYFWEAGDGLLHTEPGDYNHTIHGTNGDCDTRLHLHLELNLSPPFNEIRGLGNVAVATNYWPGEYSYFIDDSTGVNTGTLIWELSDNENHEWDFKPHGASCNIVTYTMGTKVLSVRSTDNDNCNREVTKIINCSGYAVGENELLTVEVYPNPATNELTIKSDEMKEVAIFNLLGQRLMALPANGENEITVDVSHLPNAFYLLEVQTQFGNKTRLVSVVR